MKKLFLILFLIGICESSFADPIFIQTNDFFQENEDLFDEGAICRLTNHNDGVDYVFGVNAALQVGDDVFTVENNQLLLVGDNEEVEILFWTDVFLMITGSIVADGASFDSHPNVVADSWGSIVINGNGAAFNGVIIPFVNGHATFTDCDFSDGGSGNGAGAEAEYDATITLSDLNLVAGSTVPVLTMTDCLIDNSISDGILVNHFAPNTGSYVPQVTLDNTNITDAGTNGIHFEGDIPVGNGNVLCTMTDGLIQGCGTTGIIHDALPVTDEASFQIHLDGTTIDDNGVHGISVNGTTAEVFELVLDIQDTDITSNGGLATGYGVYVFGVYNHASTIDIYNGCLIQANNFGGIRLHEVNSDNEIRDSRITGNGLSAIQNDPFFWDGAGIRVHLITVWGCMGHPGLLVVENCEIDLNGHEGICVSLVREAAPIPIVELGTNIIGNDIHDNAAGIVIANDVDFEAREGSGIHILGDVAYATITNNVIEGGISGICWDSFDMVGAGNTNPPIQGRIRNNIQFDADFGLYINDHSDDRIPTQVFDEVEYWSPDYETHFYNNTFWNNDIAGCWVNQFVDEGMFAEQIQSNVFGNDVIDPFANVMGIDYNPGAIPGFGFNGFWNNNDNGWGNPAINQPVTTVEADPNFVDIFHLYWNSPMINRGCNQFFGADDLENAFDNGFGLTDPPMLIGDDDIPRDGSRNDIGAFGGAFANGIEGAVWAEDRRPIGVTRGEYGFDPYCKIDANNNDVSNDQLVGLYFFDSMEDDYYRAFNSFTSDDLDIDAGVYLEMKDDVLFQNIGDLQINGVVNNVVRLANYPDQTWDCLKFTAAADRASNITYTNITGAETGLYITGVANNPLQPNERINVENIRIFDCLYHGIYIFASPVHVHGDHIDPDVPEELDLANQIWNILDDVDTFENIGIYISNTDEGEVLIEDTYIHNCGDTQVWQGETGIYFQTTAAVVNNVSVEENGCCGLSISNSAPDVDGGDDPAVGSTIRRNGAIADEQEDDQVQGAEIFLETSSYPDINYFDIYDDRDENHGLSIYKEPANNPGGLDAENCFWDQPNPNPQNPPPPAWFYWDDPVILDEIPVDFDPWLDDEVDLDDFVLDYNYGKSLFKEGQYEDALRVFNSLITNQPRSTDAINSLRVLPDCYLRLDMELDSLYQFYSRLGNRMHRSELAQVARSMIPRLAVTEDRIAEAIELLAEQLEEVEDEVEEIGMRRRMIDLVQARDANEIDSYTGSESLMHKKFALHKRLQELVASKSSNSSLPSEFRISAAYPNPFNSSITLRYDVPVEGTINLTVHDISGREVAVLHKGQISAGSHSIIWNSRSNPTGVYTCKMESKNSLNIIKVVLLK